MRRVATAAAVAAAASVLVAAACSTGQPARRAAPVPAVTTTDDLSAAATTTSPDTTVTTSPPAIVAGTAPPGLVGQPPPAGAGANHGAAPPAPRPLPAPLAEPDRTVPSNAQPVPPTDASVVWPQDFPDPYVLRSGLEYYAFSTQSKLTQVPTLRSTDLRHWTFLGDALARLPAWADWGFVWGPSVVVRQFRYVLYYATRDHASGRQCISRAVSVFPQGPYVDASTGPLVCQLDRGGSIDPNPYVDPAGNAWLVWKSEGTVTGEPTRIWSQPLSADGQSLLGQPTELLHTGLSWEGPIIERPTMARLADGRLLLLYAANRWETASYAIGWATCAGPAGPCQRSSAPLMSSHGQIAGPGGPCVFADVGGQLHLAFHAWTTPYIGYPAGARRLHVVGLTVVGDRPVTVGA